MLRRSMATWMAVTIGALLLPAVAGARVASGLLTGADGDGSFNATLPCGAGDGPSWRYFWLDAAASSPGGLLLGTWNGSFEVHDAGEGRAFIPNGDGRLAITVGRGGTGFLETMDGAGCGKADLTLTTQPDGDPEVTGEVDVVATGGTGALRGLTGSGTATIKLELGPGADNQARIEMTADLDVADPQLSVVGASSRWQNISAYLGGNLTVYVTIADAQAAGEAFEVGLANAAGGTNRFTGLPSGTARIPAGGSATFAFTMNGASPNKSYTLSVTASGKDGMLAPIPPVSGTVTFKSPLLP